MSCAVITRRRMGQKPGRTFIIDRRLEPQSSGRRTARNVGGTVGRGASRRDARQTLSNPLNTTVRYCQRSTSAQPRHVRRLVSQARNRPVTVPVMTYIQSRHAVLPLQLLECAGRHRRCGADAEKNILRFVRARQMPTAKRSRRNIGCIRKRNPRTERWSLVGQSVFFSEYEKKAALKPHSTSCKHTVSFMTPRRLR